MVTQSNPVTSEMIEVTALKKLLRPGPQDEWIGDTSFWVGLNSYSSIRVNFQKTLDEAGVDNRQS
jgi:hypothetical protein